MDVEVLMGRARWSSGLVLASLLIVATPVAARGGVAQPRLDVDQTITLTLAGFAPDVVTTYTDVPVAWLNLLSVTAHLNGGTPYKAHLPWIFGGTPVLLATRPSTEVAAKWPLGGLGAFSATIPPGARFVFTFTTPGD